MTCFTVRLHVEHRTPDHLLDGSTRLDVDLSWKSSEKLDVAQRASEDCRRGREGRVVVTDRPACSDFRGAHGEIDAHRHPLASERVER